MSPINNRVCQRLLYISLIFEGLYVENIMHGMQNLISRQPKANPIKPHNRIQKFPTTPQGW